ncbi:helicase [Fragilaria crotonensis]|nr:helicase [Fragilaria crotonensis]
MVAFTSPCSLPRRAANVYRAQPLKPIQRQLQTRLFSTEPADAIYDFFAAPDVTFQSIGVKSPLLLQRLEQLGLSRPSAVQASAYPAIQAGTDVTIGAETGSGKTLAYLLPLVDEILQQKAENKNNRVTYDFARAIILVPNKELVNQVVRMAMPLCGGSQCVVGNNRFDLASRSHDSENVDPSTVVRIAVMPGGLSEPKDFQPFRNCVALGGNDPPVDIIISTPAAVGPLGLKPANIEMFADINTLIVDEADMLLDGGYIRQLENVLLGFRRTTKLDASYEIKRVQHVFVAATLPDMGLRSVDAYLQKKFPYAERVAMAGMHSARHYGLRERTLWMEIEGNKERMERLVELLKTPPGEGGLLGEKVMVFLNSGDDVDGAQGALERAGFPSVKYHAKIPLEERTQNLERFRNYSPDSKDNSEDDDVVSILVCTDLGARGLDVPGVTAVVQLEFAGNVVAHLHRMGRCGRAGNRNGRGIIFYDSKQRELIEVVREAEQKQERMILEGDVDDADEATVKEAFSRKRGFTKKLKKQRRGDNEN